MSLQIWQHHIGLAWLRPCLLLPQYLTWQRPPGLSLLPVCSSDIQFLKTSRPFLTSGPEYILCPLVWNSAPGFLWSFSFSINTPSTEASLSPWHLGLPVSSLSLLPRCVLTVWLYPCSFLFIVQFPQGKDHRSPVLFIPVTVCLAQFDLQWILIEWKEPMPSIAHRHRMLVKKVSRKHKYLTVGGRWLQIHGAQLNHPHSWPANSVN